MPITTSQRDAFAIFTTCSKLKHNTLLSAKVDFDLQ